MCAAGFSKSQSATLFPLPSIQLRLVLVTKFCPAALRTPRPSTAGLELMNGGWFVAAARYFPSVTLTAVLPFPNRSYASPIRGVMSLYPVTPSVAGNVIGAALNRDVCGAPFPSDGNQLHARSYRTAPWMVARPIVH